MTDKIKETINGLLKIRQLHRAIGLTGDSELYVESTLTNAIDLITELQKDVEFYKGEFIKYANEYRRLDKITVDDTTQKERD